MSKSASRMDGATIVQSKHQDQSRALTLNHAWAVAQGLVNNHSRAVARALTSNHSRAVAAAVRA